jgi:hypothetical protein
MGATRRDEKWLKEGEEFLCDRCPWVEECEYAFDAYNVVKVDEDDWCLADK